MLPSVLVLFIYLYILGIRETMLLFNIYLQWLHKTTYSEHECDWLWTWGEAEVNQVTNKSLSPGTGVRTQTSDETSRSNWKDDSQVWMLVTFLSSFLTGVWEFWEGVREPQDSAYRQGFCLMCRMGYASLKSGACRVSIMYHILCARCACAYF